MSKSILCVKIKVLEGGRLPSVKFLRGGLGVSLRIHYVRIHIAQEDDGAGVLDIVYSVVDVVGRCKGVGVGLIEIFL